MFSGLVLLLSIAFKMDKESNFKKCCIQNKWGVYQNFDLGKRKNSLHIPQSCSVCMKGNQCIRFPAFILKLATVSLILHCHMFPETGNNFLLVISLASQCIKCEQYLNLLCSACSWIQLISKRGRKVSIPSPEYFYK